ncbi:Sulfate permease [Mycena kentingensis (nom. inval.)]|nr:Sulfate permease [Mycena kentingensis (nom. inval.)]
MDSTKRLAKRVVSHPEESPPYISTKDYLGRFAHDPRRPVVNYLKGLFPIISWLPRYNVGWLSGDIIAGLTVGMVLVPQGMSYAQIATLPTQYGLYSSFVGVTIYCLFATSKDVSIGPVAVMSLIVGQIITRVTTHHPGVWEGPQIATTIAFICGFITLGIGLLRLGWIVEFIPAPAVSGFMTGSAISIAAGQVPGLMGITGFNTRAATYEVIINTLKGLPHTKLDAAWGLPALVALYAIRYGCEYLGKKYPRRARLFFFISVLRNAFVILVMTIAAWLYTRHRRTAKGTYPIKILQTVPRGLQHVGQPKIDHDLLKVLGGEIPLATIVLLLEHIAISKSFGRLNNYVINPNQELIAIGVTNTIGSCFGAYPATGSFSRSALKSKSGVRTPAAGLVSSVVVLVALYGLTPAFFWIPNASLAAVIIHAVADLVASPSQVYSFWRVSPLEFIIWLAAVLTTIFSSVENGIYASVSASVALLLIRIAHPRGAFLGRITVRSGRADSKETETRDVYIPLTTNGVNNRDLKISPPSPGVVVYRFEESAVFPNAAILNSELVAYVKKNMRRGKDMSLVPLSERPWNDPGPSRNGAAADQAENDKRPDLRAIVIDLSAISHLDITATQALIDTRNEVERWADHPVEFHFATILSPWIRRALIAGGFGTGIPSSGLPREIAQVVPFRDARESRDFPALSESSSDLESGDAKARPVLDGYASVLEDETPFFHLDLPAAMKDHVIASGFALSFSPSPSPTFCVVTPYMESSTSSPHPRTPGDSGQFEFTPRRSATIPMASFENLVALANYEERLKQARKIVWRDRGQPVVELPTIRACLEHASTGGLRSATLGFTSRAALNLVLALLRINKVPRDHRLTVIRNAVFGYDSVRFAAMLGTFASLYKFIINALPILFPAIQPRPRGFDSTFEDDDEDEALELPRIVSYPASGAETPHLHRRRSARLSLSASAHMALVRKKTRRWHAALAGGIAGGLAILWEKRSRRVIFAQQLFVRGLQGSYNAFSERHGITIPYGSILLFAAACGQIMYAFTMRPDTLPRGYINWIQGASRITADSVAINNSAVRDHSVNMKSLEALLALPDTTARNRATLEAIRSAAMSGEPTPAYGVCAAIHPLLSSCWSVPVDRFFDVFKWMLPVYSALHFIPPVLFRWKNFKEDPGRMLLRSGLGSIRSSAFLGVFVVIYQCSVCMKSQAYQCIIESSFWRSIIPRRLFELLISKGSFWIPGFLAGLALLIEDGRRRAELAMYVLPKGLESAWLAARGRGYVFRTGNWGESVLTGIAMAMVMSIYQNDPAHLSGLVRRIMYQFIGPN